jgi:hypothetical protein
MRTKRPPPAQFSSPLRIIRASRDGEPNILCSPSHRGDGTLPAQYYLPHGVASPAASLIGVISFPLISNEYERELKHTLVSPRAADPGSERQRRGIRSLIAPAFNQMIVHRKVDRTKTRLVDEFSRHFRSKVWRRARRSGNSFEDFGDLENLMFGMAGARNVDHLLLGLRGARSASEAEKWYRLYKSSSAFDKQREALENLNRLMLEPLGGRTDTRTRKKALQRRAGKAQNQAAGESRTVE